MPSVIFCAAIRVSDHAEYQRYLGACDDAFAGSDRQRR